MAAMPPDAPGKILVPRWVQLVGLPLAIVGVWLLVSAVNHAVFVFVVAALIAILLNPIVRAFCALRIPRGVAVLLVYLFFAFVVGGMSVIVGTVIAREVQDVANQVEDQFKENHGVTPAEQRLADLQRWIDRSSPVKVDVQTPGKRLLNSIDVAHLQRYSGRAVEVARSQIGEIKADLADMLAANLARGVFLGTLVVETGRILDELESGLAAVGPASQEPAEATDPS